MALYHLAFITCAVVQGRPLYCEAEKMIDTQYYGLVACYSAAKRLDERMTREFLEEAKSQGDDKASLELKTRCLSTDEGETFLKQQGPSALIITGKKFE